MDRMLQEPVVRVVIVRHIVMDMRAASSLNQNSKTKINQGAVNDANINVNNSSGTRITNEQTIKQSVRINNEVNNLIRNNQVNKIIKENTVSLHSNH